MTGNPQDPNKTYSVKTEKLQDALKQNMRRRKAAPKPGLHKQAKKKD